jgi:hypothetical protein
VRITLSSRKYNHGSKMPTTMDAKDGSSRLRDLPVEMLLEIMGHLKVADILRLGRTNKAILDTVDTHLDAICGDIVKHHRRRLAQDLRDLDFSGVDLLTALSTYLQISRLHLAEPMYDKDARDSMVDAFGAWYAFQNPGVWCRNPAKQWHVVDSSRFGPPSCFRTAAAIVVGQILLRSDLPCFLEPAFRAPGPDDQAYNSGPFQGWLTAKTSENLFTLCDIRMPDDEQRSIFDVLERSIYAPPFPLRYQSANHLHEAPYSEVRRLGAVSTRLCRGPVTSISSHPKCEELLIMLDLSPLYKNVSSVRQVYALQPRNAGGASHRSWKILKRGLKNGRGLSNVQKAVVFEDIIIELDESLCMEK